MATGWIGRLGSLIIREPTLSSEASQEMLRVTSTRAEELKPKRRANSVDSLSPKSRFLKAVNTIPMTPGVPYHTIIGDRGRGHRTGARGHRGGEDAVLVYGPDRTLHRPDNTLSRVAHVGDEVLARPGVQRQR